MSTAETYSRPRMKLSRMAFSVGAVLAEFSAIVLVSMLAGAAYTSMR